MINRYLKSIGTIESAMYLVLMAILTFVLLYALIELILLIYSAIFDESDFLFGSIGLLTAFEFFLLILIGLELLETIKAFLTDKRIHLEIVITLATIAIARKIIVIDVFNTDGLVLVGIGIIILSLAVGYYLVKKADLNHYSEKGLLL